MKLYQKIAQIVDARLRCLETGNTEWFAKHTDTLAELEDLLPSGGGFDTTIDTDHSKPDRLVLSTSYHHMSETGYYTGWTDHTVLVQPSLIHGFTLRITGKDKDGFKDYAYDVFQFALDEELS